MIRQEKSSRGNDGGYLKHARQLSGPRPFANRIELAENTVFGFFFVLDGQPRNASVKIRVIWRYPDPGIKSGDKMKFSDEYDADVLLNDKQWLYWNTAGIWNEVPTGIWTCELWYGERRITRQDFEVVRN